MTDPMTIAFPFAGDSIGGSHVSVLGLLNHLDRSRFRPLVILEVPRGQIAQMFAQFDCIPDPGARSSGLFAPGRPFGPSKFIRTMGSLPARIRLLRKNDVDLVHSNDGRSHAQWALAARLAGIPLLWHHRAEPNALGLRLAAPLLASRVLAVSRFSMPSPGWWSAAAKSEVVHSPFDTDISVNRSEAREQLYRELGVDPNTLLVGFFGSFVPRKRPVLFVDAIVELQKRTKRPVLGLMFGDSSKNAEVTKALDARVKERDAAPLVRVLGFRDNGAFWIAACDQLMVTAVDEPFGRTLIEAMLVGTPVIAAASGGNIEALEGGRGVLVPADDAAALAAASERLVNSPEKSRRMTEFARTDAHRRFGDAQHALRVSEIYEELAGAKLEPRSQSPEIKEGLEWRRRAPF